MQRPVAVGFLALLAASGLACSSSKGTDSTLTGTISADGSSTVFLITEAVAEEFKKDNGGVDVTVGESGTGGGFKKFCNGETDVQDASRAIKDEEKTACAAKDVEYVELEVAKDGLSVVVNKQNTWATCLTVAELKKIWEPKSAVTNWRQVRSSFPDQTMKLYGPGTASGTFDYFTQAVNGEEKASRTDYTGSEDDNTLVQGVAGDKGALGYFGFAYYAQNTDKLNVVQVDGGGGCIAPSEQSVKDLTYKPLSRPLFIYVKKSALQRAEVKAFVSFYLDSLDEVLGDVGYTELSSEDLAKTRATYAAAV